MRFIFSGIMELTYITSRNKKAVKQDFKIIEDFQHLKEYQKDAAKQWKYVNDKWLGLRNHISPPPIAVTQSSGDCDDFASHMYQRAQKFNPLLLTYFPVNLAKAHTVVVLQPDEGEWAGHYVLMNWSRFNVFTTRELLERHLANKYVQGKIISYHWAKYDYEKGRFRNIKEKNVKK